MDAADLQERASLSCLLAILGYGVHENLRRRGSILVVFYHHQISHFQVSPESSETANESHLGGNCAFCAVL